MPTTKGVPMLSPVMEDFVPPQFRGNVPDDVPQSPTTIPAAVAAAPAVASPPLSWWMEHRKGSPESDSSSVDDGVPDTGFRSRVALMLFHWRKRAQGGPVQFPQKKPVQVQGLPKQKSKKYPKPKRSISFHYLNPLCLLAKLRDTYIHMMNNVASSRVVAGAGQGPVCDHSATQSTLFFSREFDAESMAQLVELERSSSKPDSEYRQNLAFSRNACRVKPYGDLMPNQDPINNAGVKLGCDPVLLRSKSKFHSDNSLNQFSASKLGAKAGSDPVLSRSSSVLSRSNSSTFSDEVFFSRKLKGSRKKLHINPYADDDWKASSISETKAESKVDSNDFHFQREPTNSGTDHRLQRGASEGSLFAFKH